MDDHGNANIFRQAIANNRPNALRMLLEGDIAATDSITKGLKTMFYEPVAENDVLFVLGDWLVSTGSNPEPDTSLDQDPSSSGGPRDRDKTH